MLLGRVVGTLVSTRKEPSLEGLRFLVVRRLTINNQDTDGYVVASDAVGAGLGEVTVQPGDLLADVRPVGHHADGGGIETHLREDRSGRAQDLHQLAVVLRGFLAPGCGLGGFGPGRGRTVAGGGGPERESRRTGRSARGGRCPVRSRSGGGRSAVAPGRIYRRAR